MQKKKDQQKEATSLSEIKTQIENLPYGSQLREPITAAIPYLYRWKIFQIKQMLYDLKMLDEKYNVEEAAYLAEVVKAEARDLCVKLAGEIIEKRGKISEWRE